MVVDRVFDVFVGDEILSSYVGIISEIMTEGSLLNTQYFMESIRRAFFFVAQLGWIGTQYIFSE